METKVDDKTSRENEMKKLDTLDFGEPEYYGPGKVALTLLGIMFIILVLSSSFWLYMVIRGVIEHIRNS